MSASTTSASAACSNGHVFVFAGDITMMQEGYPCQCGRTKYSNQKAMSIQRYDLYFTGSPIEKGDDGEYVLYSDHLLGLQRQREELLAWLKNKRLLILDGVPVLATNKESMEHLLDSIIDHIEQQPKQQP